jgi:alkylation response protein AidB-like acyl-CoA dehydrogenase
MLCSEITACHGSFAVSLGAHTGIGSLPITYFGTKAQKEYWLPMLATGEKLAAYCLTEPGSGSDALAAKTVAMLDETGENYILNGSKMWITNCGFADVFVVFCQIDGDKFSAFIVPAETPGVTPGAEERKLGLKGSSTALLTLENVKVPKGNLLGEIGKGHKIAFNILNIGRFKLGVGTVGQCKHALAYASTYANERKQFRRPISSFGAIRGKLADMTIETYALESMCYRVAGYMDLSIDKIDVSDPDYTQKVMKAIEEYTVEDSILKVYGSEVLSRVADEALQIFGGYGYSEEYPAARTYRDARINRIFEGTNEINRMLIPGTILKNTMKGKFPFFTAIKAADDALAGERQPLPADDTDALAREAFLTEKAKQLSVHVSNKAIQRHMADLKNQQEILMMIADMMIACYVLDSTVARTRQLAPTSANYDIKLACTYALVASVYPQVVQTAQFLLEHLAGGDQEKLDNAYTVLDKLTYRTGIDTVALKRKVADAVVERQRYPL